MGVYLRDLPEKADGTRKQVWTASVGSKNERMRKDFATKRAADAWHAEMTSRVNDGTANATSSRMTVADLWPEYDAYLSKRRKRGERVSHKYLELIRGNMRNYVLCLDQKALGKGSRRITFEASLAKVKLSALTPSRVERFKEDLRDAGVSIPTTRAILRNLSSMLAFARRRDYVRVNAASDIKVIGNRNEGSEKVVPPPPVLVRAMVAAASPDFQMMLKFLSVSGARISEALALRWGHLDWEENEVHIKTAVDEKTLQEDGYGAKTYAGNRTIPIASAIMKELAVWRESSRYKEDDDLIFPNSHGRYRSQGNDRKRKLIPLYHKVVVTVPKKARLAEEFGFHALRHYAISSWIAQGLPLKAISTFAGHSSVKITMDRYGHLFPSEDHAAAMERVAMELG